MKRMKADYRRLGKAIEFSIPEVNGSNALVTETTKNKLYLEELQFTLKNENLKEVVKAIALLMGYTEEDGKQLNEKLNEQLVIVHNDIFNHLSRYATPVVPHISIDSETKTTKGGALWYEESLPPDTLLYSALVMQKGRKLDEKNNTTSSEALMKNFSKLVKEKKYLQVGGNETTGMGWCRMSLIALKDDENDQSVK